MTARNTECMGFAHFLLAEVHGMPTRRAVSASNHARWRQNVQRRILRAVQPDNFLFMLENDHDLTMFIS